MSLDESLIVPGSLVTKKKRNFFDKTSLGIVISVGVEARALVTVMWFAPLLINKHAVFELVIVDDTSSMSIQQDIHNWKVLISKLCKGT